MKRILTIVVAFGLAIGINVPAFAGAVLDPCPPALADPDGPGLGTPPPFALACGFASINSQSFDIPVLQDGKFFRVGNPGNANQPFRLNGPGFQFQLTALLNPDPVITLIGSLFNTGSTPLTMSFFLVENIVPVGSLNEVSGLFFASLAGATINPVSPPAGIPTDSDGVDEIAVFTVSSDPAGGTPTNFTNMGVDVGLAGSGPYDTGTIPGPNPGLGDVWNYLRADVSLTVSPGGSVLFGATGTIDPVTSMPEPGTLLLIGSGLVGIGVGGRRRKRK